MSNANDIKSLLQVVFINHVVILYMGNFNKHNYDKSILELF